MIVLNRFFFGFCSDLMGLITSRPIVLKKNMSVVIKLTSFVGFVILVTQSHQRLVQFFSSDEQLASYFV